MGVKVIALNLKILYREDRDREEDIVEVEMSETDKIVILEAEIIIEGIIRDSIEKEVMRVTMIEDLGGREKIIGSLEEIKMVKKEEEVEEEEDNSIEKNEDFPLFFEYEYKYIIFF